MSEERAVPPSQTTDEHRREETAEHEGVAEERVQSEQAQGSAAADPHSEEALEEEMRKVEEDPPDNLEDWPDGPAKYKTFGGPEGDHSYEEGPERKLGPSSLRRFEDGSIEIEGEAVDNPDDYKRDAIEDPLKKAGQIPDDDDDAAA